MAQLHLLASLHGQRGNLLCLHLRHQLADASGNLHSILVELVLPQHAGENRAAQSLLRRDARSRRSLVSAGAGETLESELVQAHGTPPFKNNRKTSAGE